MTILQNSDDPRFGFERFRRTQLWRIAEIEGIEYPAGATAMAMIPILSGAGINSDKYLPLLQPDALHGQTTNKNYIPNTERVEQKITSMANLAGDSSYDTMGFNELKKECKEKGLSYTQTTKKDELLGMLNGYAA